MGKALPTEVKTIRWKMSTADSYNKIVVVTMEMESLWDTAAALAANNSKRKGTATALEMSAVDRKRTRFLQSLTKLTAAVRAAETRGEHIGRSTSVQRAKYELLDVFEEAYAEIREGS